MPATFDLRGILSLALQILGLTYAQIRPQLVEQLGEPMVAHLETAFEVVRTLLTEGLAGIWSRITEFLTVSLPDMVIGAIRNFVMERIVAAAVTRIVSMLNPAGAVIQAILAIYNTVMFFIERMSQMLATVQSFVQSIARIAAGDIASAANAVEQTMARTLPVIISFLARLLGLGGISEKIREIIQRIQAPIQAALGRVIGWIVAQAKKLGRAVFGGGSPASAEGEPETPASTAVKDEARTQLESAIGPSSTPDEVRAAIPAILSDLRPRGLQNLTISENDQGGYSIFATASPPTPIIKLVAGQLADRPIAVAAHTSITFSQPVQLVETQNRGHQGAPLVNSGQGAVVGGSLRENDFNFRHRDPGVRADSTAVAQPFQTTAGIATDPRDANDLRNPSREGGAIAFNPNPSTEHELMTWNAGGDSRANVCNNSAHAERTLIGFVQRLPVDRKRLIHTVNVEVSITPCAMCSAGLVAMAAHVKRFSPNASLNIVWSGEYKPEGICAPNLMPPPNTIGILRAGGWRNAAGPVPANAIPATNRELQVQRKPKYGEEIDGLERTANHHARSFVNFSHNRRGASDRSLRTYGEYFGADFSDVRIHNNARSADLCEGYQARAFTHGNDIYFNQGEHDPSSRKGQDLLAHELTHVIQQGAAPPLTGSVSPTKPDADMKIRPTFRRSARRVSRRAPDAPFFQTEAPAAPFFAPAAEVEPKLAEEEPIQPQLEEEEPVMAKCDGGSGSHKPAHTEGP